MKKIYTLIITLVDGTVTIQHSSSSFTTRELAEKAKAAVDEANKNVAPFAVWSSIEEIVILKIIWIEGLKDGV